MVTGAPATVREPIRQAVVLVGGRGTRLGELARDVPKPLLPIDGDRVFLDYILESVARHGYFDVVLLAGHLGEQVESRYAGRTLHGSTLRVLREPEPLGTGGALTVARAVLDDAFLMMNGDALFDINLRALEAEASVDGATATLALKALDDTGRYGRVTVEDGRVVAFVEKDPTVRAPGTINGGIYVLRRSVVDLAAPLPCSIERDVFPLLVTRGEVRGRVFDDYFIDIGTPESLARGRAELPAVRVRPAVFLVRDAVLDVGRGAATRADDLALVDGAAEAVRHLNDRGYFVFLVDDRPGIARGDDMHDDSTPFTLALRACLARAGAHVDGVYAASCQRSGTGARSTIEQDDGVSGAGLLHRAFAEWPIARAGSFLVAVKPAEAAAAARVGLPGVLCGRGRLDTIVKTALGTSGGRAGAGCAAPGSTTESISDPRDVS
ncbi:sugar phosphate nucleotidyltransferase [Rhodoplanes sp. TEM]|uniref:Sugar phosphate nucleotidyltransferase n=2 Tax=Rhodoplanes TaxID=29407 RepID=A0ABT5J3W1_RHOTP|nr:sugar phosphate nucleotidyltransferase [Rhodoplanes tepidamans]MDC7784330.1 sugar phosphate nucleotidyltransferase [Rhodoplanes tepidamans]MDC7983406.1 sugar phosphate nucleotidyltransferase [Rhodoplanes sp. TEM]MDQ0354542.1 D-glycero-D-manno-heptose 1,7-bisphosphate phosphatase [Rhodoplanes tepidamans]